MIENPDRKKSHGPSDDPLENAWSALEEGDPEGALEILSSLGEEDPDRWITQTLVHLELGELTAAEKALDRARRLLGAEDPDVLWATAELFLMRWQIGEARDLYERLAAIESTRILLERIALCLDLQGDFEAADRIMDDAEEMDPEEGKRPVLSAEEFEGIVQEAVRELPEVYRSAFETMAVVIDPVPDRDLVTGGGEDLPPDILGFFEGVSMLERSVTDTADLPPVIYIFRRNLERMCRSRDELRDEIRVTLYHELGHALGHDEEGLREIGLD
jgi:predicted Zn-dependent protease with MMP-like domain